MRDKFVRYEQKSESNFETIFASYKNLHVMQYRGMWILLYK